MPGAGGRSAACSLALQEPPAGPGEQGTVLGGSHWGAQGCVSVLLSSHRADIAMLHKGSRGWGSGWPLVLLPPRQDGSRDTSPVGWLWGGWFPSPSNGQLVPGARSPGDPCPPVTLGCQSPSGGSQTTWGLFWRSAGAPVLPSHFLTMVGLLTLPCEGNEG